jgi:aryl-alcohol dehydrogenase-like predicted oxidoreductase
VVRTAYDHGVTYFDTAEAYQGGRAEEALGEILRPIPRSKIVVATKAYWPVGDKPTERGLSRKRVMDAVHGSLRRLGMEYVDIWFCHRYDADTPVEETLRAIDDLIRQGKILYAGVSEWTAAQLQEGLAVADQLGIARYIVNQPHYNILAADIEAEILPLARREGIGQVVFSPLAQGLLTGKYRRGEPPPKGSRAAQYKTMQESLTDRNLAKVERLSKVAQAAGLSLAQMSVAWTLRDPVVSAAIVGASSVEQIEETVKAGDLRLEPAVLKKIDAIRSR